MALLIPNLLVAAALVMTLLAAVFDWRRGVIPPWVSLSLLPVAPILHAIALSRSHGPYGLSGALWGGALSIIGALLCALVPYILFRLGLIGGGDVKVLASLGALLGPHWALPAEFYALVLAAVFASTRLAYQGRLFSTLGASALALVDPLVSSLGRSPRRTAPDALWEDMRLSPFVFLGTVASLVGSSFTAGATP
jgi:Flp pilus assembly protein protease CpaA